MKIDCPHYSREAGNRQHGLCALGWSGGRPFAGECLKCLKEERNTPAAYVAAQTRHARTHPEPFRGLSGCCDRADLA